MSKVAVVYWSGTGNTETMANAVAEGAKGAGAEVDVLVANDFNSGKVAEYDGSYGWGSGEWMADWEERSKAAGAVLATDSVICQEAPDDDAVENCKKLGAALA